MDALSYAAMSLCGNDMTGRGIMKAIDAANFFIDLAKSGSDEDDGISNMKLNKLLFFAQAISLQRYGRPLFDDPIEAWTHGPVVPSVYHTFKSNGRNGIPHTYGKVNRESMSAYELAVLVDTYQEYGRDYTAGYLRNLTHQPGTPWSQTKAGETISVNLIDEWAKVAKPSQRTQRHIPRTFINRRRNDHGVPVVDDE
ncbi:SocA family protein [Bifidobacterium simiarum]|nr:SocA family protein [Bifidobacterium simiarum]